MEKFRLIGMTDFILERDHRNKEIAFNKCFNYANFLKQPLKLEMFVPCDDEGNVLFGKPLSPATDKEWDRWEKEQPIYEKAKAKVLFEGFENTIKKGNFFIVKNLLNSSVWIENNNNIEALLNLNFEFRLTQSALDSLGLNKIDK